MRRGYLLLGLIGIAAAAIPAFFQQSPGYMDADYYYIGARRLVEGRGFSEMILWNYLDDPTGLPHPSHGYWMPFTSLLAALGMALTGSSGFPAARIMFVLLAAAPPILAARLALRFSGAWRSARLAGILAALPGFYLAYLPTTDSFAPYMVLGGLFFLIVGRLFPNSHPSTDETGVPRLWSGAVEVFGLGLISGVMHLTRADGILWLPVALGCAIWTAQRKQPPGKRIAAALVLAAITSAGYLAVMGPWMGRNLAVFGSPLAPGGSRALWITGYDELFTFPAERLTLQRWLDAGIEEMLEARSWALGMNLQTVLAVQGQLFLTPLILLGMWQLRRDAVIRVGAAVWLLTFLAMSLIFPFQGARGGFFHSGAALQTLFFAAAPSGLDVVVDWGSRKRSWNPQQAWRVFSAGMIVLAAGLALFLALTRSVGEEPGAAAWNRDWTRYQMVELVLPASSLKVDSAVMVNNAPAFYAATGRPAVSIPFGDLESLLAAANGYGVRYLLVELDQVQGEQLYEHPQDRPGLRYLGTAAETRIYEIIPR